jgi:hypothetical protein
MVEIYEILLTEEAYRVYEDADPVLTKQRNRCFQYQLSNLPTFDL